MADGGVSAEQTVATADLLPRLAAELDALARAMDQIQSLVSPALRACPPDADGVRQLQALDRVTQSLDGLGRLLALMAERPAAGVDVTAAHEALRLGDLSARLLQTRQTVAQACPAPDNGTDDPVTWL